MTKSELSTKSLVELTAIYNASVDKPIKKFTCSKAEAVERVLKVLPKSSKKSARGSSTAGPRTGVCSLMTTLFAKGLSPKDVHARIHAELPACKTSLPAVYWMRSYLRQQGAQV